MAGVAEPWLVLDSGVSAPAFNMALDEALLEGALHRSGPVVRFYGWTQPAATFGYSQRWREVVSMTSLRPLIRRPTGGGVVLHEADWTYSVVIPPQHAWYRLRARASYARIHAWVAEALVAVGLEVRLASEAVVGVPGACFAGAEAADVIGASGKVAGAAQRRNHHGLLIQGSLQPPAGAPARKAYETAFLAVARLRWGVVWDSVSLNKALNDRAETLVTERYGRCQFNQAR